MMWYSLLIASMVYFFGYRNVRAYQMRMKMLDQIAALNRRDVHAGNYSSFMWRYAMFESVSWWRIIFSVRRFSPANYYNDVRFLLPNVRYAEDDGLGAGA